ncbi:manganese efflux pump MntP family protein [Prevotella sp. P6B4]|uniref:manganese efflux pump MntP n=1 Tax=Prevotella sp. P6B4 TaxID=1410614 RepID=UPI00048DA815|nr:manganese efflux pump MntP family protein [Prevotella sp. P6B4]
MNSFDIWLLAVALAMDCFTVSIVSGVIVRRWLWAMILRMAFLFGLFQAMMPLIGWLGTNHFSEQLEAIDHWIAFGLLAFIGGKMIRESFGHEEEKQFNPQNLKTQLLLAVATSIDALAIGISFACTGYNAVTQIISPLYVIGLVSFLFSLFGYQLGVKFGKSIARKLKPELLGGSILIGIGIKILITHLLS